MQGLIKALTYTVLVPFRLKSLYDTEVNPVLEHLSSGSDNFVTEMRAGYLNFLLVVRNETLQTLCSRSIYASNILNLNHAKDARN